VDLSPQLGIWAFQTWREKSRAHSSLWKQILDRDSIPSWCWKLGDKWSTLIFSGTTRKKFPTIKDSTLNHEWHCLLVSF
jgi:hypothetical protein